MLVERDALVTFDLDSTLADTSHRHDLIDREGGTDWHAYSAACGGDTPILGAVTLVRVLAEAGVEVHALSGRKATSMDATQEWFRTHDIPITRFWLDETDTGDHPTRHHHVDYKLTRLREIERVTGKHVVLHVDDWAEVAVGFENAGVPCICVRTPSEIRYLTDKADPKMEALK